VAISSSAARAANRTISVDEALERVLARMRPLPPRDVPLAEALGTVLAEAVSADMDLPPFHNSGMDGYAVRASDVATVPSRLRVTMHIAAGQPPAGRIEPGEAARIMTGAPLPDGADTIVRIEDTDAGMERVEIRVATARGTSVRLAGEDMRAGSPLLERGRRLRPAEIGVLASTGRSRVSVFGRPRVAVISTGDELVEIDERPGPGKIRDINRSAVGAAIRALGGDPWQLPLVRDNAEALRGALQEAMQADAVVTSGGVSVGDHDHVKPVIESMGSIDFWSMAIRPGKPFAFGEIGPRRTPIFGLPGNPVSSLLTFEILVRPALRRMAGHSLLHRPRARLRLADAIDKPAHLRFFARGVADLMAGSVRITGSQGSNVFTSMALANCLIALREGTSRAEAGSAVEVILTDLPEDH